MDARVSMTEVLDAFGVPATVRRPYPDSDPIETVGCWVNPTTGGFPIGVEAQRRELAAVFSLSKVDVTLGGEVVSGVPTLPLKTRIAAPEFDGGAVKGWLVDGFDRIEDDHVRAIVIRDPDYEPDES